MADRPAEVGLQDADDLPGGRAPRLAVGREHEDRGAQQGETDDVERAVEGDQPQHVAVAQGTSAQRHLELVGTRDGIARRLLRGRVRHPRVAAQAPVPAQAVGVLPRQERVLGAHGGRVGADEGVAVQGTAQQLVAHPHAT